MQPKVSVIIPVYNNAKYLKECLDSAANQTLQNIEIICVNDGSTDDSLSIMRGYAEKDPRIVVIDKPNGGYGHTMNKGLEVATGKYVAFLESDDTIKISAYETLSKIADEQDLDIVKGDYYELEGMGEDRKLTPISLSNVKERYNVKITPREEPWTFYMPMMNCLGLFRRDFLIENNIVHNETPGAAHQDMGFWFQTFAYADSLMFINEPFYEYRQDNMNASMKSDKTTFSTIDEYNFIRKKLEKNPEIEQQIQPIFFHRKYTSSMFSYGRAELSLRLPFLRQLASEFKEDINAGHSVTDRFKPIEIKRLNSLIEDPDGFYIDSLVKDSKKQIALLQDEISMLRHQIDNERFAKREPMRLTGEKDTTSDCLVSFIISCIEEVDDLASTIDSIINLNEKSIEIVCTIPEPSKSISTCLGKYADQYDFIRVFSSNGINHGAANNLSIEKAKGSYIQFLDSGDTLKNSFSKMAETASREQDFDVIYFNEAKKPEVENISHDNKKSNDADDEFKMEELSGIELIKMFKKAHRTLPSVKSCVFKRSFLVKNGIRFLESNGLFIDDAFPLKALCVAEKIACIDDSVYIHKDESEPITESSKTAKKARSYFETYYQMLLFASQRALDYDAAKVVSEELDSILSNFRKEYSSLTKTQRLAVCTMPPIQETLMDSLVAQIEEQKKRIAAEKKLKKADSSKHVAKNSKGNATKRKQKSPTSILKRLIRN